MTENLDPDDKEWLDWGNALFCSDQHRSSISGPKDGFTSIRQLRDFIAERCDRRFKNSRYREAGGDGRDGVTNA